MEHCIKLREELSHMVEREFTPCIQGTRKGYCSRISRYSRTLLFVNLDRTAEILTFAHTKWGHKRAFHRAVKLLLKLNLIYDAADEPFNEFDTTLNFENNPDFIAKSCKIK